GCIIPALLRHAGPVIVVDPKGENAAVTARRRQAMGQQVVVLDPMGITEFEGGALNPFDLVDVRSSTGVDDAAALVGTLLPADRFAERNQYWLSRAQQLLTAIVLHVAADLPPKERRLRRVREIVNAMASDPDSFARIMGDSRHPE